MLRPPLTPGADRFKPVSLLRNGRFGMVTVLLDMATKQMKVGRCLAQAPGSTEVELLEGIARQARVLKTLSHSSLPAFDRVVEGDGGTWMLFDYQPGTLLSQYVDREATVPDDWIVWWLHQLLLALEALHTHTPPLVAGYIEPADIVVCEHRLVLVDQGLFEDIFPEAGAAVLHDHLFVNFIAPEKRNSPQKLPLADLFSAGAIAYWLMSGHAPTGSTGQEHVDDMRRGRPDMAAEVIDMVAALLSYYPSQRPPSAREALTRLSPYVRDMKGEKPPLGGDLDVMYAADPTRHMQDADMAEPPAPRVPRPRVKAPAEIPEPTPRWNPVMALGALLLAMAAIAVWRLAATPPAPPPGLLALTLLSGQLLARADTSNARWRPMWDIPAGTVLASQGGASLRFDRTTVSMSADAVMLCAGRNQNQLTLDLTRGGITAQTGPGDTVHIKLSDTVLDVRPDSDVAVIPGAHFKIACSRGEASVAGTVLGPGNTFELPH